jgi:protein-disulfide isomerase
VVKFNDYECPPCKQTFNMYKPVKSKWEQQAPGQVKFVSKDFPLEPECNKAVPRGIHQFACEAAAAVRLARTKGKADAMEDWLFANQGKLSAESIKQAVRDIGGVPDFDAQYAHVLNDVRVDTSLGGFLGVNSTPTFFINGVRIDPWLPEVLDAAIAYELQKSSK